MTITRKEERRARFGPPRFISIDEYCAIRNCGRWKAYQDIKKGRVRSFLDGGSRRLYAEDAEKPPHELESIASKKSA